MKISIKISQFFAIFKKFFENEKHICDIKLNTLREVLFHFYTDVHS